MEGDNSSGYAGGGGGAGNVDGDPAGAFVPPVAPHSGAGSFDLFNNIPFSAGGSSSEHGGGAPMPATAGNIFAQGFPGMGQYGRILHSKYQDWLFGSSEDSVFGAGCPPPVRIPAVNRSLWFGFGASGDGSGGRQPGAVPSPGRPPRSAQGGRASAAAAGGRASTVAARGRSRRRATRRGAQVAMQEGQDEVVEVHGNQNTGGFVRANWTDSLDAILCRLYVEQMHLLNVVDGKLTKTGWRDLTERFRAATNLNYDTAQLKYRYNGLKNLWKFIQRLRNDTGLGKRADGSVIASTEWWNANAECAEHRKLQAGWPHFIQDLDTMCEGVTVDGSSVFMPEACDNDDSAGDDDDDEEVPLADQFVAQASPRIPDTGTPTSTSGMKRASSTSTTASSPNKKSKSPAVRVMNNYMDQIAGGQLERTERFQHTMDRQLQLTEQLAEKNMAIQLQIAAQNIELRQRMMNLRMNSHDDKVKKVMELARECGVDESNRPLKRALRKIINNANYISMFIHQTSPKERLEMLMDIAGDRDTSMELEPDEEDDDEDGSEDESGEDDASEEASGEAAGSEAWATDDDMLDDYSDLFSDDTGHEIIAAFGAQQMCQTWWHMILEDEATDILPAMCMFANHHDKYLNRAPYRTPKLPGEDWVLERLGNSSDCYDQFRMSPSMFHRLHELLVNSYGLKSSTKSSSLEALGMFLWILGGQGSSTRKAKDRLERSLGTVHNNFKKVLKCVVQLAAHNLKPADPEYKSLHPRLQDRRFSPFFNNCIGALDGTHIECVVDKDKMVQHMCRKGITTQNVLAIADFDMRFTFVLAGWPGSVHDMTVLRDATTRFSDKFPHPPPGKFYLVDSGYPNRPGYLAPYKGHTYHVPEFQQGPPAEGKEEIFNFAHSSLRNVVERAFGMLKMKWRILLGIPRFSPKKQTQIIYACFALHNFIINSGLEDIDFILCDHHENYISPEASIHQPGPTVVSDEISAMNGFREQIANGLVNRQHQ